MPERRNAGTPLSYHQRYLELYKLIERKDKRLGSIFNDHLRRSRAVELALMIKREGLMPEDEFEKFSAQTQRLIVGILDTR